MTGYKTTTKMLSWVVMAIGHENYESATLPTRVRSMCLRVGHGRC